MTPLITIDELKAILADLKEAWGALASVAMQVPGAAEVVGPRATIPAVVDMVFEQAGAAIHPQRAEWDGVIRFDSDCIVNGMPVKAGAVLNAAASETRRRLSRAEVLAWANRHDIRGTESELREMLDDARSIQPGDPITNGIPSSEDPPSLR